MALPHERGARAHIKILGCSLRRFAAFVSRALGWVISCKCRIRLPKESWAWCPFWGVRLGIL